jgi:IS30 family transposase
MPDPRGPLRSDLRLFWTVVGAGEGVLAATAAAGASLTSARRWLRDSGGVRPLSLIEPSPYRLSLADRERIGAGLAAGWSFTRIGHSIGRPTSTVTREVRANMRHRRSRRTRHEGPLRGLDWRNDWEYLPARAQLRAENASRRPQPTKLAQNPRLLTQVQTRLEREDSPEQIARRLVIDFPHEEEMRVSHETIYKALYVQGRGELRRDLHKKLRTGRAIRKPRRRVGQRDNRGRIPDMVHISERPAEVEDRAVPGHWEGDLILGTQAKSAIGTLVERTTRYLMLLHLPDNHGAEAVQDAMVTAMSRLPEELRKTLTWDQGKEMSNHVQIAAATDLDIYFCDPHSPWQRGTNENTNGLLRQYFPKGTELSGYTADYLEFVAARLNTRPRKTLNWRTPAEALDELLSHPPQPPAVAVTA